ncbi:hypothetical protein EYF80_065791 [Liparis tanakae]|uniref:Uncharacterized protein n=1 Tax=Liparis tanakae TaxID=230148 RepID=A0A4Z2E582_9TELE|nr:hypothetical protein EYF80_065791 [Liparis tanakae]
MAKVTHHISCPCGRTDSRGAEGDRGTRLWFLPLSFFPSGFLPLAPSLPRSLPPILYVPFSHPPSCPGSPSLLPDP